MNKKFNFNIIFFLVLISYGCATTSQPLIQDVNGAHHFTNDQLWLSHEHILVDYHVQLWL